MPSEGTDTDSAHGISLCRQECWWLTFHGFSERGQLALMVRTGRTWWNGVRWLAGGLPDGNSPHSHATLEAHPQTCSPKYKHHVRSPQYKFTLKVTPLQIHREACPSHYKLALREAHSITSALTQGHLHTSPHIQVHSHTSPSPSHSLRQIHNYHHQ